MAWKGWKKDEQMTLSEAMAQAKAELTPFWHGSPPLLIGLNVNGKSQIFPLEEAFKKQNWLIYLLDATDFSGRGMLVYAREFHKRYGNLGLNSMAVFRSGYSYFKNKKVIEGLLKRQEISFPVAVDPDSNVFAGFGVEIAPKVILMEHGTPVIEQAGEKWIEGFELSVQAFLRKTDPGLPLFPPFSAGGLKKDISRFDLNKKALPGIPKGLVKVTGKWSLEDDRAKTADSKATLAFTSTAEDVTIIVQTEAQSPVENSKIIIEINGAPSRQTYAAKDLIFDEDGHSCFRPEIARLYHVLEGMQKGHKEITLRFPNAERIPVGIFGMRFSEKF